jgi:hypothetical protein
MIGDYQTVADFIKRLPGIDTITGGINVFITQMAQSFEQEFAYEDFIINNEDTF